MNIKKELESFNVCWVFDINIINELFQQGRINKERYIICNGFKRPQYVENIAELINQGFENTLPVLDNKDEIRLLDEQITGKCKIGIRIAAEEEPMFEFWVRNFKSCL